VVTGVCSERNVEFVRRLGCREVVNYERERFADTDERYRVVLDAAGRESPAVCRRVLAADGRHVTTVPRREALRRAAADLLLGSLPGRRPTRLVLVRSRGRDLQQIADLAEAGRLRVEIQQVWPLAALGEALAVSRGGHARGKLVVRLTGS
jgi:NADPH:quinone reductase-like Zn-dependent oxidoreductase